MNFVATRKTFSKKSVAIHKPLSINRRNEYHEIIKNHIDYIKKQSVQKSTALKFMDAL